MFVYATPSTGHPPKRRSFPISAARGRGADSLTLPTTGAKAHVTIAICLILYKVAVALNQDFVISYKFSTTINQIVKSKEEVDH